MLKALNRLAKKYSYGHVEGQAEEERLKVYNASGLTEGLHEVFPRVLGSLPDSDIAFDQNGAAAGPENFSKQNHLEKKCLDLTWPSWPCSEARDGIL